MLFRKTKLYNLTNGMTHRVRVSTGHLGNAEAPTEPAGETIPYEKNKMSLRADFIGAAIRNPPKRKRIAAQSLPLL